MAEILRKIDRAIHKVLLIVADVSLVAMVLILTYTVVLRYVFNTGVAWAEEVPRLLVTVFVFLSCAMGVRDHMHITVNIVYNRLRKGGIGRRALEKLGEVSMLLCGVFMFFIGGQRVLRMMKMPGILPMTGLPNWVQYVAVPIAGAVIVYDCILFLTGVLKPGDWLYSEPEIDYVDMVIQERKEHMKEGHA
ncbi:MAG: TRAP transporter small permease [Christensenellales bacterium]